MFFHSPTALFCFLPIIFIFYPLIEKKSIKASRIFLLIFSLIFYGFDHPWFVLPLLLSAIYDYFISKKIIEKNNNPNQKKYFLISSIVLNIGLLFIFKYIPFIEETLTFLNFKDTISTPWEFKILLPAGISFYTFQTLSFVFDIYRGEITKAPRFIDYLLYVCYFPQLVAGPILRPKDFFNDQSLCKIRSNNSSLISGFQRICFGLFLKLCLADELARLNDIAFDDKFSILNLSAIDSWTMAFGFGFQIYFDFSAYSHLAIGISEIIGLPIKENFNLPYLSKSATEFWRRWHISLSSWVSDYLYKFLKIKLSLWFYGFIPLITTWSIMGLWHGASWRFIAWGSMNGLFVLIHRFYKVKLRKIWILSLFDNSIIGWILTLSSIMTSWIYFRATTFYQANQILKALLSFDLNMNFRENYYLFVFLFASSSLITCYFWENKKRFNLGNLLQNKYSSFIATTFCFFFSLLYINRQVSFIYFQF